jgi:hypothetical protein
MKTKSLYILALTFLFVMASYPLYAAESHPMAEPVYTPKPAAMAKVSGVKTFEGNVTGEIICLYEWETDQAYQGTGSVCLNPRHNQRALVTEQGEIYLLVADEKADSFVLKALSSDAVEREDVSVKGEIVEGGPVKVVKVKSLTVK